MSETQVAITQGSGTNIDAFSTTGGNLRQAICVADPSNPVNVASVDVNRGLDVFSTEQWTDQAVSVTGASGAAVTATLPAVSGMFHYVSTIVLERYAVATLTASATPIVITSTNLPGNLAWIFDTAGAIGTSIEKFHAYATTIKSSVVNTATTIIAPATTSVIWRINVHYYLGT